MQYLPHYDRHTGIVKGSIPSATEVLTRRNMIAESGLVVVGETWDPEECINVPIYEGKNLSADEMQIMCLKQLIEKDVVQELLQEYQKEYIRVNRVAITVFKINNHKVSIGGNEFPAKKLNEFIARLKEKPSFSK